MTTIKNVWRNRKGYICLTIDKDGKTSIKYLHRYLWKLYHPDKEIPKGWEIHHYDSDISNHSKENLWCIPKDIHIYIERQRRKVRECIKRKSNILLFPPKSASILVELCERMDTISKDVIDTGFSVSKRKETIPIQEHYIRGY